MAKVRKRKTWWLLTALLFLALACFGLHTQFFLGHSKLEKVVSLPLENSQFILFEDEQISQEEFFGKCIKKVFVIVNYQNDFIALLGIDPHSQQSFNYQIKRSVFLSEVDKVGIIDNGELAIKYKRDYSPMIIFGTLCFFALGVLFFFWFCKGEE